MNHSHLCISAIVILTAFLCQCSDGVIQFPRDIPTMRRLVRHIRRERNKQIKTEEEKRTFRPNVPHLCNLEPSLLEEVCEEVIRSKIIGVDRIFPPSVSTKCLKWQIAGTKATKRVVECAVRDITWDRKPLEPGIIPLPKSQVEIFLVGASTATKNKIQLFIPAIFETEPKAVVLSEIPGFVLTNHPDVKFIDNDIKDRFEGDESDISYDEAELRALLRAYSQSNNDARQSSEAIPRLSVSYR